jgi:AraC-like DNA-binding protein
VAVSAAALAWLSVGLRGGFVVTMLLLAGLLWRQAGQVQARLAAALAIGAAAYAVQSALLEPGPVPPWQWPLNTLATGNPVVLWLLAQALFDDQFRLRAWQLTLWLGWMGLGLLNCSRWHAPALGGLLSVGPLLFSGLALWPLLHSWRSDLVEARLALRWRVLVAAGGYTAVSTLLGLPAPAAALPSWAPALDAAVLLALGLAVAWPMLALRPTDVWLPPAALTAAAKPTVTAGPASLAPALVDHRAADHRDADSGATDAPASDNRAADCVPADPATLSRLARAMDHDQAWRREGLTIGQLAVLLGVPDYRLRRAINQQLGHRNFNSFLNAYRIAAAKAALADPAQRDTPVLGIALAVGFQSLGPFNRAFKADTGLTPSEFRRQAAPGNTTPAPG